MAYPWPMIADSPSLAARVARLRQLSSSAGPLLIAELRQLAQEAGLAVALQTLFRQQVAAGYVLFDPADPAMLAEKHFPADAANPEIRLQWNPQRELRLDPALLVARGVIAADVDPSQLINRDAHGRACYLCRHNIALQSPAEIVLPITLGNENHILGSNFAPITDNHFTVIPEQHRPQKYEITLLQAGFELAAATKGRFRVLYNSRAGASILSHQHLHATDTRLPAEALSAGSGKLLLQQSATLSISQPDYPLPLWLIEGDDATAVAQVGDRLIRAWQRLDQQRHSENLLLTYEAGRYRLFIVPRDLARLTAPGRTATMGSFEVAGLVVLSHGSEQALFDTADATRVQQMLAALAPVRSPSEIFQQLQLGFSG